MRLNNKLIYSCVAGTVLVLSACSNEAAVEQGNGTTLPPAKGAVTFSLQLETSAPTSRAGVNNDGNSEVSHIGKGEKIDLLLYSIYTVDEDGKYANNDPENPVKTIPSVDFSDGKRVEFTIDNLLENQKYSFVFWAQNSGTTAFDTSDLSRVEVKYTDASGKSYANNDETRDAFCQVWTGTLNFSDDNTELVDVTLKRPLAQINVGTTGADYKNIIQGVKVFPNLKITHSKISVKGVARFLNVVENRILLADDMESIGKKKEDAFTDVTFDWNVIPAFMNLESVPTTIEGLLQNPDEEYLRVDLDRDGDILDYLTSFPTLDADGSTALTETFKYLSMCYVLAPAASTGYATYGNIKVAFAEDETGKNTCNSVNLASANGGRNYRTNILGGLGWVKDPNPGDNPGGNPDPDDPNNPGPDDPNNPGPDDPEIPQDPVPSLFYHSFRVLIQTEFQGSYTTDKDKNWTLTWAQNTQD